MRGCLEKPELSKLSILRTDPSVGLPIIGPLGGDVHSQIGRRLRALPTPSQLWATNFISTQPSTPSIQRHDAIEACAAGSVDDDLARACGLERQVSARRQGQGSPWPRIEAGLALHLVMFPNHAGNGTGNVS